MAPNKFPFPRPLHLLLILGVSVLLAVGNGLRTGTLLAKPSTGASSLPRGVLSFTKAQVKEAVEKKSHGILDVRPEKYFKEGHLPGALSLPYDVLPQRLEGLNLNANGHYILYCDGGDCHASLAAARLMASIGYAHLAIYPGGWQDWQEGVKP